MDIINALWIGIAFGLTEGAIGLALFAIIFGPLLLIENIRAHHPNTDRRQGIEPPAVPWAG